MGVRKLMIYESRPFNLYGAQRALLYTIDDLLRRRSDFIVVVPGEGPFTDELRKRGAPFRVVQLPVHLNRYNRTLLSDGLCGRVKTVWQLLKYWLRMARTMTEERVSLLYAVDLRSVLLAGPAAKLLRVPVVWHMQLKDRSNLMNRIGAWLCHRVVAVSMRDRDELAAIASRVDVTVIYNSVDPVRFRWGEQDPQRVKAELGIPAAARVVGMVGSIEERKAQLDFLQMARRLASQSADVVFLLVGNAHPTNQDYYRQVEDFIARHGLINRVFLLGYREDPARVLSTFDVFVLPSKHEAFPLSILEAMALKIPVVATDVGGVSEMVRNAESGILIQPGDVEAMTEAVRQLLTTPGFAAQLAETSYRMVLQRFTMEQTNEQIYQLISSCAGGEA